MDDTTLDVERGVFCPGDGNWECLAASSMEAGIDLLPLTGHWDADDVVLVDEGAFTVSLGEEKKRLHNPPDLFSAVACNVASLRFITGHEGTGVGEDAPVSLPLFSAAMLAQLW